MRPTRRALGLLGVGLALGGLAAFVPAAQGLWIAVAAGSLALALADGLAVRRAAVPETRREVPGSLPLGVRSRVRLSFLARGRSALDLDVFDHHPTGWEVQGLPFRLLVPAGGGASFEYQVRPCERGQARFGKTEALLRSPLKLWQRRLFVGGEEAVRVLPNFRPLLGFAALAVEDRLGRMGIRRRQRRGEGREFHELRDFRQGDTLRQIDWKATSRRLKLIVRDFQDESDQRILLLVDCGRRMRSKEGDIAHFDHALNAVLLLAYAATRYGDAVGLATFGGSEKWLAPRRGPAAVSQILAAVYDLETSSEPPDYLAAALRVASLERRRALVILVSNLRDEDAGELLPALRLLSQRHLVLVASLRERALAEAITRPIAGPADALAVAACHHYLAARERAHEELRGHGVLTLDVEPERLPIAMVNRYLDIKAGGLL
ncbi:MAG: DUF58 domain-containing protein [Thermoanaerobaculia bacterium]